MGYHLHSARHYGILLTLCTTLWDIAYTLYNTMGYCLHSVQHYGILLTLCTTLWDIAYTLYNTMGYCLHSVQHYGILLTLHLRVTADLLCVVRSGGLGLPGLSVGTSSVHATEPAEIM